MSVSPSSHPRPRINIAIIDPPGAKFTHFLFDPIRCLQYGLESLDYSVTLSRNQLQPDRLNILLASHLIPSPEQAAQIVNSGIRYILLQSEVLDGFQVNGTFGSEHFERTYLPLMRGAVRLWDWSEKNLAMLKKLGLQGDRFELGFHPDIADVRHKKDKEIDVLWYGGVTPYRKIVLSQLPPVGIKLRVLFEDSAFFRNDAMASARIILSLQQGPAGHVNPARILHAVNNRCLVVGETPVQPHWVLESMLHAPAASLPELIKQTLARDDLDAVADRHYQTLRKRPMSAFLEPMLSRLPRGVLDQHPLRPA